jgi:hypothetical protein
MNILKKSSKKLNRVECVKRLFSLIFLSIELVIGPSSQKKNWSLVSVFNKTLVHRTGYCHRSNSLLSKNETNRSRFSLYKSHLILKMKRKRQFAVGVRTICNFWLLDIIIGYDKERHYKNYLLENIS